MALFRYKCLVDRIKGVSLQCVFHSIRFKVNKGLGSQRWPIFFAFTSGHAFYPLNDSQRLSVLTS
jgi:hypothetical protein